MKRKAHGIGLLSGGLDSALAAKVVQAAGADVTCLHFFTGFCVTGHNSRIGRKDRPVGNHALQVAAEAGIPVELVDISDDYLPMVMRPKHGYGRNMNPCIDCRLFMIDRAHRYMQDAGADFVFTGEVIGQRPMSQMRQTMQMIEHESGLEGRLLRPLSAQLLEPTLAEREGWIDREKLCAFHGRSRKPQIELAAGFGLTEYMQPAGGCCFLTDEAYSRKLRDLVDHMGEERLSMDDVYVLGVGRHFRLSPQLRIVVGRDEVENAFLEYYSKTHWSARATDCTGPTAIVMGEMDEPRAATVAAVVARYCKARDQASVRVEFRRNDESRTIDAAPLADAALDEMRI
jgi:tRNA U34 2-thiouridine synthase MnmA/TrmU